MRRGEPVGHLLGPSGIVGVKVHRGRGERCMPQVVAHRGQLGATFEGLLRKHRRFGASGATGDVTGWRTTAQYAMTDDDWPAARAILLERMSRTS